MESSGLPVTPASSADQNVTDYISCEKPEERWPCVTHKLKQSKGRKDWQILNKTFKLCHGAPSLTARDVSCSQVKQITFS